MLTKIMMPYDFGRAEQCVANDKKNNEILEINVLQKFTSHALYAENDIISLSCSLTTHTF